MLTLKKVNALVKHLDVELVKGEGYFYLLDADGRQIGESICVYRLNHMSLEKWLDCIEADVKAAKNLN
jgi:hypothetical protein